MLGRRGVIGASAAGFAALSAPGRASPLAGGRGAAPVAAQIAWEPVPAQKPVSEGVATFGDARLAYWDTGGAGEPIVLLHPATGSAACWGYQQPVFAAAGYRVIAYSRRGFHGSGPATSAGPGGGSEDLQGLADFLKLDRFHLLGSAAGGFTVADYALAHPERLHSFILANSVVGVADEAMRHASLALTPEAFTKLPPEFRELGPSYRAANPDGVAAWVALTRAAHDGPPGPPPPRPAGPPPPGRVTWDALAACKVPGLMLTGDADLYMPPAQLREFGRHLPRLETVVIAEAGHSAYWEQPIAFNRAVLGFLGRHRR